MAEKTKTPPKISPKDLLPEGYDLDSTKTRTNAEMLALPPDGYDLHALLTNTDVIDTRLQARAAIMEEKKAAAKAQLLEEETQRLRDEEGLVTGGPEDELREIVLDLAPFQLDRLQNQRAGYHTGPYTVPTHLYRTLQEIMHRGAQHEHSISGKPLGEFYRRPSNIQIGPGRESWRPSSMQKAMIQ